MPSSSRIKLEPNKPITITLLDPFADSSERYDSALQQCEYRTTDGRVLALPRTAAIALNELDPQPGEEIGVCRYTGKQARIAVWLTASAEKARAEAETACIACAALQPYSLGFVQYTCPACGRKCALNGTTTLDRPEPTPKEVTPIRRKTARESEPQPRLFDQRGTGTDGPAPQRQPRPAIAARTPYGTMLRHIIHTVEAALKAEGVQLGDAPKQDLYTTVYIDAARRCGVEYDFTSEVER